MYALHLICSYYTKESRGQQGYCTRGTTNVPAGEKKTVNQGRRIDTQDVGDSVASQSCMDSAAVIRKIYRCLRTVFATLDKGKQPSEGARFKWQFPRRDEIVYRLRGPRERREMRVSMK